MESFLIETTKFKCRIGISEGIIVYSDPSLKWALGKKEDLLMGWLNKAFGPQGWKKTKQELIEEPF